VKQAANQRIFWVERTSLLFWALHYLLEAIHPTLIAKFGIFRFAGYTTSVPLGILVCLVWSIVFYVRNSKSIGFKAFRCLFLNLGMLLIIILFPTPLADVGIKLEFKLHDTERQKLVQDFKADKVNAGRHSKSELTNIYGKWDCGNWVDINKVGGKTFIYFILDGYVFSGSSGYVYYEGDEIPPTSSHGFLSFDKLADHWFFTETY
jgi:hypothetical protein